MEQNELQVSYYLKVLWNGKWLILVATLAAFAGVALFAAAQPAAAPTYRAVATIKVEPVGSPVGVDATTALAVADRSLNTQILILQSRNVMERTLRRMQPPSEEATPEISALQVNDLRTAVSVRSIKNANLLEVSAKGSTPAEAEGRANAVVAAYIDYLKEERTGAIEEALEDINTQLHTTFEKEQLNDFLLIIVPDVELTDIILSIKQSISGLGQLQFQENPGNTKLALGAGIPRLEKAAADLNALSRDLQVIQTRLEAGQSQTPAVIGSSLSLQTSRLSRSITDLDLIYSELREVRSQVSRSPSDQSNDNLADQAEVVRDNLELALIELGRVTSGTLADSRKIASIDSYVESVVTDLRVLAFELGGSSGAGTGLAQTDRISLQGQVLAHSVGLDSASDDLTEMRNSFQIGEYGRILAARGHIETANTLLRALSADLAKTSDGTSTFDSINEVMNWSLESRRNVEAVINNFLRLQVLSGSAGERDGAIRASGELDVVSITLEIASSSLRKLATSIADPLSQGRLKATAARLTQTQASVSESSSRLRAIAQKGDNTLSERLETVRERIQDGADDLLQVVEALNFRGTTPGKAANVEAADLAYTESKDVARSLDVASRQLQRLIRGNADPLLGGELGSLEQRLATAHGDVQGISGLLANVSGGGDASLANSAQYALTKNKMEIVVDSLSDAARIYFEEQSSESGINTDEVARVNEAIDVASAILVQVAEDIVRLQRAETDSLRFGQLAVLARRVDGAKFRTQELSGQLGQLGGSFSPDGRETRQLKRQLELSLLQPQETGITQVDSAVSPQFSRRGTFFAQARVPLGAAAGFLVGVLAVFFRAQTDPTVRSQAQLRDRLGFTSLGVVPKGKRSGISGTPLVSNGDQPAFSEALQIVGTGLSAGNANQARSFLIASAEPQDGRTTLAINLAHVLSQHGRRVLLVDGNLRKPDVARVLGLPGETGLSTALAKQVSPMDYIVDAGRFSVLPGGQSPENPVDLLSSPAMSFFLQQANRQYDVVLVDSPPALGFAEIKSLATVVNAALMVVRSGKSRIDKVEEAKVLLEASDVPIVAGVLNFAPAGECSHLHHEKYNASSRKKMWRPRRARALK